MIQSVDIQRLFPQFLLRDKNGYAMAKALQAGLEYFLSKVQEGLDTVLDVDRMPEWRLDEMAWEYNVVYDYTAEVTQKREWIRRALPMYRILGTRQAVLQYLEGYFGEIEIQENWEYGGEAFHFRITVGGEWTPENENWARKAIDATKPVRSLVDGLRPGCRASLAIAATGTVKNRFRYPFAGEITAGEHPTENHMYMIDESMRAAVEAREETGRIAYDMAGEKPEINHGFIPDGTGLRAEESEEVMRTIYYPLCGDAISGE